MTKAERIYKDTCTECKKLIRDYGYQVDENGKAMGYKMVSMKDNEHVSNRTLNEMTKYLESDRRTLSVMLKFNVIDQSKYEARAQVLNAVETTIEKSRKAIAY